MFLSKRFKAPESRLPELAQIERTIGKLYEYARVKTLDTVHVDGHDLPIHAFTFGSTDPTTPVFAIFGGIHGLERIGTHICLSWLNVIGRLISWDNILKTYLKQARLVLVPLVNPGGMYLNRRSNPNGVDLMRNAPVTADSLPRLKLLAGHRLSAKLPWYQGPEDAPMEPESQAIVDFVKEEIFPSDCAITLDCHSGFGLQDRLWFPYAKTVTPFPHIAETYALFRLFNKTYPDHIYKIEPQSNSYTTHGDLWDYLYDEFIATKPDTKSIFLPLCLEMGSWAWVRKNPKQLFSPSGPYNPVQPHRMARAKRRHLVLMDFLMRTVLSPESWASLNTSQLTAMRSKAMRTWY